MHADIQLRNDIAITIHKFEDQYRVKDDGTKERYDVVVFSPRGDIKTRIKTPVANLSKVLPVEDAGDNIAYLSAARLWAVVEPQYQHWLANNALPESGTPLAAWGGLTKAQAQVFQNAGIRTVEDIANASDIVLTKVGIADSHRIRDLAQKYLGSEDDVQSAAKLTKLEAENAELREQMGEMMRMMREMQASSEEEQPRRRGRPRKEAETVEITDPLVA